MDKERLGPPENLASSVSLFRRAKGGDDVALETLYSRYLPRLSRWASGRLSGGARSLQDTSDVVQDVMTRFLHKIDAFEPRHDGALLAYLRTAILNRIRDVARSAPAKANEALSDDTGKRALRTTAPTPIEECIAADTIDRYETALARLTEDERAAVILKIELDFSPDELAQALEKPSADAARMFAHRAILKLAREMKRH